MPTGMTRVQTPEGADYYTPEGAVWKAYGWKFLRAKDLYDEIYDVLRDWGYPDCGGTVGHLGDEILEKIDELAGEKRSEFCDECVTKAWTVDNEIPGRKLCQDCYEKLKESA